MRAIPLLLLPVGIIGSMRAQAGDSAQWTFATGAQYSSGAYGDITDTRAFVIPFYARMSTGRWSVQVSLPFVSIDGPQSLTELVDDNGGLGSGGGVGGSGSESEGTGRGRGDGHGNGGGDGGSGSTPPPVVTPTTPSQTSGFGDTSVTAAYSFDHIGDSPIYLDVRGRVRLPTGRREDGTGTGATDYSALAEVGLDTGRVGLYLTGGRRFLGHVDGVDRVDGWQAGAGAWYAVTRPVLVGFNVDWRDASIRGGIPPRFVEGFVAWRLSEAWKIEMNAGRGLSDSSADFEAGFTLSWRSKS